MRHRSELLQVYSNFAKMVETQFSELSKNFDLIMLLNTFIYAFQVVLHSYGIYHQLTCPGTSQQNGRVERKFHYILDTIRAFLLSAKVLAHF